MVTEDDRSAHAPHGKAELCDPAIRLYEEALKTGQLARADVSAAPCLIDLSLLYPDPWNDAWLRPTPPSAALAHLLQPVSREIEERLQLSATLSRSLLPLTAVAHGDPNMAITVLEGIATIQASIDEATATATEEIASRPAGRNPSHGDTGRPGHRRTAQHRPPPHRGPRRRRRRPQDGHQRPHLPRPHRQTHADPRRHQSHPPRGAPRPVRHRGIRPARALTRRNR